MAHALRGRMWLRTGEPDKAVADLERAAAGAPGATHIQNWLAQARRAAEQR